MNFIKLSEREEFLAQRIVNAAYIVHKELGPGLLERIYETCVTHVLRKEGIEIKRQVSIPIKFQDMVFDEGLKVDLCVEDLVICEIKAVEMENPVWKAQVISHLKLTGYHLGFLINFNVPLIKDGISRFIR